MTQRPTSQAIIPSVARWRAGAWAIVASMLTATFAGFYALPQPLAAATPGSQGVGKTNNLVETADSPAEARQKRLEQFRKRRQAWLDRMKSRTAPNLPSDLEKVRVKKVNGFFQLPMLPLNPQLKSISTDELNTLLEKSLSDSGEKLSPKTISDDQFVRRAYLDVLGHLPAPADIEDYLNDTSPNKKEKFVDALLRRPRFGENLARYWNDAISYRNTAGANRTRVYQFQPWLAKKFNDNIAWDKIVSEMIQSEGLSGENPAGMLIAAHQASPAELAGEVSRLFLGIQISCAQCHDHPTMSWKREQFHHLAAFFGKTALRLVRDDSGNGPRVQFNITSRGFRPYTMPNLKDPTKRGKVMDPLFLTGQPISDRLGDSDRRKALASFITSERNTFFAKAFVNRVWAELIGYGFTNPVDDLASDQPVMYPAVFEALSQSFAASNYDVKKLYRTVLLSKIYDRKFTEQDYEQDVLFRTINPTRLTDAQLVEALDWVLGGVEDGRTGAIYGRRFAGIRQQFRQNFGFDPSSSPENIKDSVPQALTLMNHPTLNRRLLADSSGTLLNKLLETNNSTDQILEKLYLRTLARKPTDKELAICQKHLKSARSRKEGLEDILWALINSTEFLHNH